MSFCPKCGHEVSFDGDGYWCENCSDYFPPDIIEENQDDDAKELEDIEEVS